MDTESFNSYYLIMYSNTYLNMIKIANAPCSWGVLEFDLEGKAAGFEQVLDEIRETGYQGTELGDWGFMPVIPSELRKELDKRALCNGWRLCPCLS